MKALEYLKENIEQSNIPKDYYEWEIAEMMEEYAAHLSNLHERVVKPKIAEVITWEINEIKQIQQDEAQYTDEYFSGLVDGLEGLYQNVIAKKTDSKFSL